MRKLLLTLALVGTAPLAQADGTIQFQNGNFTRFSLDFGSIGTPLNFGVFWGTTPRDYTANESLTWHGPVLPLGISSSSVAGLFTAESGLNYAIPGTQPNQTVYMQVFGWSSSFATPYSAWQAREAMTQGVIFGSTDVRQVTLGSESYGAPIWQTAAQTNPNLFNPLRFSSYLPVEPPPMVPEPSAVGLAALSGLLLLVRRQARKQRDVKSTA